MALGSCERLAQFWWILQFRSCVLIKLSSSLKTILGLENGKPVYDGCDLEIIDVSRCESRPAVEELDQRKRKKQYFS